jgi:predicted dehydrogenase
VIPYRVGLVGAGHISRTHVLSLRRVPDARVVGVWSRTRARAEGFAKEFALELATDRVEELVRAVDVVCVNSPNALHAEHAILAARAGKHVIVEKPLAVNLDEAHAILEAARAAGVGLAYAEELPFVPKFVRAREILRSGALGDPLYVTQREAHAGPYASWFFTREEAGGGVLMDMACHSIECVRWLLGKPPVTRVTARVATLDPSRGPLDDHAVVQLEFASGASATCEASWVLQGGMQSRLEIWGTRGYLDVDLLHGTGMRQYAGERWSMAHADYLFENGYPQELAHFLDCFRTGRTPDESGEDGLAVLEILCAAYASARDGRTIELPFRPAGVRYAVDLWR